MYFFQKFTDFHSQTENPKTRKKSTFQISIIQLKMVDVMVKSV